MANLCQRTRRRVGFDAANDELELPADGFGGRGSPSGLSAHPTRSSVTERTLMFEPWAVPKILARLAGTVANGT
jgi:hypothetical protein